MSTIWNCRDEDWAIEVGLPGFVIQQEEVQAQAQGARMMGEKPNEWNLCVDVYGTTTHAGNLKILS